MVSRKRETPRVRYTVYGEGVGSQEVRGPVPLRVFTRVLIRSVNLRKDLKRVVSNALFCPRKDDPPLSDPDGRW